MNDVRSHVTRVCRVESHSRSIAGGEEGRSRLGTTNLDLGGRGVGFDSVVVRMGGHFGRRGAQNALEGEVLNIGEGGRKIGEVVHGDHSYGVEGVQFEGVNIGEGPQRGVVKGNQNTAEGHFGVVVGELNIG